MWQKIKTIPKDGTKVQLWIGNAYGFNHVKTGLFDPHMKRVASIFDDGDSLGHLPEEYATHWQPLPDGPVSD